jgi:hypothetical protein
MDNILFVNHKEKSCGVYQYGYRLQKILKEEKRYKLHYLEAERYYDLFDKITFNENYKHIIFNWHDATMPWLNDFVHIIKEPKSYIYHDSKTPDYLNPHSIFMSNMTNDKYTKRFALSRPLGYCHLQDERIDQEINIGSFGFAIPRKRFDLICKKVKQEFQNAKINLHITTALVVDKNKSFFNGIVNACEQELKGSNIKLNISNEIIDNIQLAKFLRKNDINIFMYDNADSNGLSSVIDHVVGTESVFAVNSAHMFDHVTSKFPELNIDNNSIKDIISLGNSPAKKLKEIWNDQVIRDQIYEVIYGNNR